MPATFQLLTYLLSIPSIALFIFSCYVVKTKSPPVLQRYKYMVLLTSIIVLHFDISYSLLLCPINILTASGMQFFGILGMVFIHSGKYLTLYYIESVMLVGLALVANAVWREYSIIKLELSFINLCLHGLHFILLMGSLGLNVHLFLETKIDDEGIYTFKYSKAYEPGYALFCVYKNETLRNFAISSFICIFMMASYVIKAFLRIDREIKLLSPHLSRHTIELQKSLLLAIKLQILAPIILFVLPVIVTFATYYLYSALLIFMSSIDATGILPRIAQVFMMLPGFFSTTHFCIIMYFTTPYREYLKGFLARRNESNGENTFENITM